MTYILEYAQPRQSSYDKTVAIWERREELISANDLTEAKQVADRFLSGGAVLCGKTIHCRTVISLQKSFEFGPLVEPNPKFLLMEEYPLS